MLKTKIWTTMLQPATLFWPDSCSIIRVLLCYRILVFVIK